MTKKFYMILLLGIISITATVVFLFSMHKTERKPLPVLIKPKIIVKKSQRILELYSNEKLIRTYEIALGSNPDGGKTREGDGSTPLGEFYIYTKNDKSKFYLSLGLSYPNIEDAKRGLRHGLITQEEHDAIVTAINEKKMPPQKTALGGEIYIHGGTVGKPTDWTQGCIALTNEEIKELFDSIPLQTTVVIKP